MCRVCVRVRVGCVGWGEPWCYKSFALTPQPPMQPSVCGLSKTGNPTCAQVCVHCAASPKQEIRLEPADPLESHPHPLLPIELRMHEQAWQMHTQGSALLTPQPPTPPSASAASPHAEDAGLHRPAPWMAPSPAPLVQCPACLNLKGRRWGRLRVVGLSLY